MARESRKIDNTTSTLSVTIPRSSLGDADFRGVICFREWNLEQGKKLRTCTVPGVTSTCRQNAYLLTENINVKKSVRRAFEISYY